MEMTMTKEQTPNMPNNAIILSQVKGNLTKDPAGPLTSKSGKEYYFCTIACNNVDNNPAHTWYPKCYFFGGAMDLARTLAKGDFIELTRALLHPGEFEDPWKDEKGKMRTQSSALMVFPQYHETGVTIPVKIIKRKEKTNLPKETKAKTTTQKDMFNESAVEELSAMEKEVVAQITI
jgi:hypothetical protein